MGHTLGVLFYQIYLQYFATVVEKYSIHCNYHQVKALIEC